MTALSQPARAPSHAHHHKVFRVGQHLRSHKGRRALLERPEGELQAWSSQVRLTASEHPTSIEGVDLDGARSRRPHWPAWHERVDGVLVYGQCHSVQVWGGIGHRPEGLVTVRDVEVTDAVADAILVSHSARVELLDCRVSGSGRAGIAVAGPGCEVVVRGGHTDQLHYEEDYPGAPGVYLAEDVTLIERRRLTWISKSPEVSCTYRRCGPVALLHLADGIDPALIPPGGPRCLWEDCEIERLEATTPPRATIEGGALGSVEILWQTRWRQWPGGVLTLRGVKLLGPWVSVGLGTIVLEGCVGDLDLVVGWASGPYRPGLDGHLVVVRDGVTHQLGAGAYLI